MKANELRINNLVQDAKGRLCTIVNLCSINDEIGIVAHAKYSAITSLPYQPIHLTKEWLLRFGFEKRESSTATQWHIGHNEVTRDWLFDLVWMESPELINAPNAPFYRNGRHTICHVHQLQNLYFALTGQELTIKEATK